MTRPLYEPTPAKTASYLNYGVDQLQRRPAPQFAGTSIFPTFRARRELVTQTIPSGDNVGVCWDSWEICDASVFSVGTLGGPGDCEDHLLELDLLVSGVYSIHVQLQYEETLDFKSAVGVYDYVTTRIWFDLDDWLDVDTAFPSLGFQAVRAYNAADAPTLRVETQHNAGVDKTIGSDDTGVNNFFQVFYLGMYDCVDCPEIATLPYIGGGGSCGT